MQTNSLSASHTVHTDYFDLPRASRWQSRTLGNASRRSQPLVASPATRSLLRVRAVGVVDVRLVGLRVLRQLGVRAGQGRDL